MKEIKLEVRLEEKPKDPFWVIAHYNQEFIDLNKTLLNFNSVKLVSDDDPLNKRFNGEKTVVQQYNDLIRAFDKIYPNQKYCIEITIGDIK